MEYGENAARKHTAHLRDRRQFTLRERLAYKFDNLMSGSGLPIFMTLVALMLLLMLVLFMLRILLSILLPDDTLKTFAEMFWRTYLQLIDAGGIEEDGEAHLLNKLLGTVSVGAGLIFFSALVAFISNQFNQNLEELRKGKSAVIESGHTLILGFDAQVMEIIEQLIIASRYQKRGAIVMVSELDKVEMDDYLTDQIADRQRTRIITRSGNTCNTAFIRKMSISKARSIIITNRANVIDAPEIRDKGDAKVLETIVAVVAAVGEARLPPIVAQLHSARNSNLAENIAPGKVTIIDTDDILACILVYTSLNPGLASVYSNIVGFEQPGIYFYRAPLGWKGYSFGKLQFHFIKSVLMGFINPSGEILLNPSLDYVPSDEDGGVFLAADQAAVTFYHTQVITPRKQVFFMRKSRIMIEKQLIVGWNSKITITVHEYAQSMRDGSQIDVVVQKDDADRQTIISKLNDFYSSAKNIRIRLLYGDVHESAFIDELQPCAYNNVVILAEELGRVEEVDLRSISRLLAFRHYFRQYQRKKERPVKTNLITEIIDSEKPEVFSYAGANDFLIPHKIVSQIMAQVSQEPALKKIYEDIFNEQGNEIYVKPVELFFRNIPLRVSFADCMSAAQLREEVCLGVKIGQEATAPDKNYGLYLPPDKNYLFDLDEQDALVTLAENRN
ncbi:hypothetical protein QUF75_12355 [Desulfococcaceae bacterium HSG7]|nr:hypothetical protein [Desulfococcaceae bacterium HSG7]